MLLDDIHNPGAEGQSEDGIAQKSEYDVDGKPVTPQYGSKGKDLFGQCHCRDHQNQRKGSNNSPQDLNPIPPVESQINTKDGPCKKREGFMEIGNGDMPCFEIPKYEGNAVKDKTCRQGNKRNFGQQFPQEDNEEKVLKGPQEIEDHGNFKKPNVHQIGPLRFATVIWYPIISSFYQNFEWVSTNARMDAAWLSHEKDHIWKNPQGQEVTI